jgi:hypothetical protein
MWGGKLAAANWRVGWRTVMKPDSVLLAVVEVEPEQAVCCMAPGCGHAVYKRIHVVKHEGRCVVLGSACFSVIFESIRRTHPRYSSGKGQMLSTEQRELLTWNSEALIQAFEGAAQHQHRPAMPARRAARPLPSRRTEEFSDAQCRAVEPEVLRLLARMKDHEGIDYTLPDWRGELKRYIHDYLRGAFRG